MKYLMSVSTLDEIPYDKVRDARFPGTNQEGLHISDVGCGCRVLLFTKNCDLVCQEDLFRTLSPSLNHFLQLGVQRPCFGTKYKSPSLITLSLHIV